MAKLLPVEHMVQLYTRTAAGDVPEQDHLDGALLRAHPWQAPLGQPVALARRPRARHRGGLLTLTLTLTLTRTLTLTLTLPLTLTLTLTLSLSLSLTLTLALTLTLTLTLACTTCEAVVRYSAMERSQLPASAVALGLG